MKEKRVLRFTADRCGPCKMVGPVIDALDKSYDDIEVTVIDLSSGEKNYYADQYSVRSIPTIIALTGTTDATEIGRITGARDISEYEDLFKKLSEIND